MTEPRLIRPQFRFEREFTQIPNAWLRDKALSLRARGLLGYLMSLKPNTRVTLRTVAADVEVAPLATKQRPGEGVDAIRVAVRELERGGYITRHPIHRGGRFIGDDWELTDPAQMLVDNSVLTALESTTREATALESTTRTALESTTPYRNTLNTDDSPSQGEYRAAGPACGECGAQLTPSRKHAGICADCRDGITQYRRSRESVSV